MAAMLHWHASTALGLLLTGRARPLCASVGLFPDSTFRRGYSAAMDRLFGEVGHVARITAAHLIGAMLRRNLPAEERSHAEVL